MQASNVTRRFVDLEHGQLHLRIAGLDVSPKPALICLHMVPKSGRGFADLMPYLAANRTVIAPDYPGYGESDAYPNSLAPTINDYADTVGELISHFQLSNVDLLGYHTGSMVAVQLAHQFPKTVRRVINISAPIFTKDEVASFKNYYSPVALDEAGTRFKIMWSRILQYRGPGMTLEMAARSLAENLRGGERYEDGHDAAFNFTDRYAELLAANEQPLLVINPGDDLTEHTRRAAHHLNTEQIVERPEWGHGLLEVCPSDIAAVVSDFLD